MNSLFERHYLFRIIVATATALLIGCSGGESGTGMQANNQTTVGEISGFGSIYVNGVKYKTDNATVYVDGNQSSEDSLAVGMVVTIEGSVNSDGLNGTAITVATRTEVEGLVLQNDISGSGTINVMGQTVKISNDTKFKSTVPTITIVDELVANDSVVEVSGYSDGQGIIYATYVKVVASGGIAGEVKLYGIVRNLSGDANSGSFNIGNTSIQVNYDDNTNFEDMTRNELADGLFVEVESSNYSGGVVMASVIEKEGLNGEAAGTELEVEGVVTDIANIANGEFSINGRLVKIDPGTTFEGGSQQDIQLEVKLEVEGKVQADNSILADEISFRTESDMEIEGLVASKGDNMLTIGTTVIMVNELTYYEDETDESNRTFNFSDIIPGETTIEAKYYVDSVSGNNIATSIEKVMPEEMEP
jgi:hypothetical protein